MTREETISILEESKRQNEIMRDNPSTFWASHQMADGVKNAERRIAALDIALTALRPVSREQVEKVWRGEWNNINPAVLKAVLKPGVSWVCRCAKCGCPQDYKHNFCPNGGAAQTDEAVEMVMERMEEMKNG